MDKKQILITGANGFIGRHFIKKYSNKYLFNTVSLSSGDKPDFSKIDTVLHLSSLVHQAKKLPDAQYFNINTKQTIDLAKNAKKLGVRHFIFYSTAGVYGTHGYINDQTEILNETSNCTPTSAYGKSKLLAENKLFSLEDDQFKISVIRPPIVYGEDCPGNIATLKKLINLVPILPFDHTSNKRSMASVKNLISFTDIVIDNEVTVILIPQDKNQYSTKQIIEDISRPANKKIFLFKPPKLLLFALSKIKPATMLSLYGTLVFDSTRTNEKTNFKPNY